MDFTSHCIKRARQRGFRSLALLIIIAEYGRAERAAGHATKFIFDKQAYTLAVAERNYPVQVLDKIKGSTIVVSDDKILTSYKQTSH